MVQQQAVVKLLPAGWRVGVKGRGRAVSISVYSTCTPKQQLAVEGPAPEMAKPKNAFPGRDDLGEATDSEGRPAPVRTVRF